MLKNNKTKIMSAAGVIALILYVFFVAFLSFDGLYNDLDMYPGMTGDIPSMAMHMRSIQENGIRGLYFNNRIGAPGSATLLDTPGLDILLAFGIYIIDLLFNPSTPRLFYYTLAMTFVASAIGMYYLLAKMKVKFIVNFTMSVLFALGPYHFYRYLTHVAIGNSVTVPFIFVMAFYMLGIIKMEKLSEKAGLVICALLLGIGCPYYTFFGFMVFALTILFLIINKTPIKEICKRAWIILVCVAAFLASRLPSLIFNLINGKNTECFVRKPIEQEIYGLKIIQLLLPVDYSRIGVLANLTNEYNDSNYLLTENYMSSLGIIGSVCFLALCGLLIYSFINKKKSDSKDWLLIDFLSINTLAFVVVGSIGGFGELFNMFVTAQIRCYNRSSIVISCMCMILAAFVSQKICVKNKDAGSIFCVILLAIGMFDQVELFRVPDIVNVDGDRIYRAFYSQMEDASGEGAMVYQLPYMDYPEAQPINNLPNYKHFYGYLYTDAMRFSYGGIKGRDNAAKDLYIDEGRSIRFVNGLINAGFSQVYIDLTGYDDNGEKILNFYDSLGCPRIVSGDGLLYSYVIDGLEFDERFLTDGYEAAYDLAAVCSLKLSDDELCKLAQGLKDKDETVLDDAYRWYEKAVDLDNLQNNQYVNRLYSDLLGRSPEDAGRLFWLTRLDEGADRGKVFKAFLKCEEYRKRYGIMETEENGSAVP